MRWDSPLALCSDGNLSVSKTLVPDLLISAVAFMADSPEPDARSTILSESMFSSSLFTGRYNCVIRSNVDKNAIWYALNQFGNQVWSSKSAGRHFFLLFLPLLNSLRLDFLLAGLVLFFVLLAEILHRKELVNPVFARKILHIGAISVSAFSVYFLEIDQLLIIIGIAIPLLAAAVFLGFFNDEDSGRKSFGILYFAISFFVLPYFFGYERPHLVFYPLMVLAWSDGLATLVV